MAEAAVYREDVETDNASRLDRYIDCAEHLIQKCKELSDIPGSGKLERKCAAELKYLRTLSRRRGGYDITHLRSSNLSHYAGVLHSADNVPHVTHILQAFSCPGRTEALHMDVVADHGHIWVKVVARKAQALHLIWAGQGQYGERDIVLQAKDFVTCSKVHPVNFVDPQIVFAFYNGVTAPIARRLEKYGIIVIGEIVPVDINIEVKLSQLCMEDSDTDSSSSSDDEDEIAVFKGKNNTNCTCFCSDSGFDNTNKLSIPTVATESLAPSPFCSKQSPKEKISDVSVECDNEKPAEMTKINEPHVNIEWETCTPKSKNNKYGGKESQFTLVEKISDTASNRLSESPLTDLFTVNKYKFCPIDHSVTQSPSENDCSTLSSIDPHVLPINLQKQIRSGQFGTADKITSKETNLVVSDSDNMSGVLFCPKKQFQTKTDLPNISVKNIDCNHDKWNFGSTSVLSFIRSELLVNPILDFCVLGRIVTANEINNIDRIGKVNLDITALITLVSAVSHGGCNFRFREKILSEQAAEERSDPVLPKLHSFLKGKQWYACQTAVDSFSNILETLGGHEEKKRALDLLSKLSVVPDEPSFRASVIPTTGKIKERSKVIFGTGDSLRAVTVTANSGFVRAAEHQGVTFAAFLHASRALTEQKECTAEKLVIDT